MEKFQIEILAVDILANVLRAGKFEDSAVEAERQVLLRRLQEAEGDSNDVVLDNLHATAFQGTPFGLSPLGTTESLQYVCFIILFHIFLFQEHY